MSKFFVQLLLSVMVGISAALGFNPQVKSQLHGAWQEVGTYLHETTNVVFKSANDLKPDVNTGISVQAVSKSSAKGSENANLKVSSNVKVKDSHEKSLLGSLLLSFSLNNSAGTQTQTSAGAETSAADVKLTEKTTTTLQLDLGTGK
jgi:hypothetical protein